MRLRCLEHGHDPQEAEMLDFIREQRGAEPPDVL